MQGQAEEGIAQIRQGIAAYRATGGEVELSNWLGLLAAACEKAGRAKEGLSALIEALEMVSRTELRWYEAELYRLKGELSLQLKQVKDKSKTSHDKSAVRSPEAEAEACFLKALEVAREQQAKSLELRAATSLSRLWQRQGKTKEAHELLAAIYGWFTEGFDAADLQEAKTLLDELTH